MEKIKDVVTAEAEARQLWRQVYVAKLNAVGFGTSFSPLQHQVAKDNADLAYEVFMSSFAKFVTNIKTGT